jgi:hypothetical protein
LSDTPRPDNDGRSRGEGPERAPDGTYNKSGIAQQEQALCNLLTGKGLVLRKRAGQKSGWR